MRSNPKVRTLNLSLPSPPGAWDLCGVSHQEKKASSNDAALTQSFRPASQQWGSGRMHQDVAAPCI